MNSPEHTNTHNDESSAILNELQDGIAIITLNRPDKFNSFNREMASKFLSALRSAFEDTSIRAILITANGKAFCAGQDLSEVVPSKHETTNLGKIVAESYNPIIRTITEGAKPVIAAVNGVAAGAGANLALACDFVIASQTATFIQAFSKVGLIPDSGGTFFLPRLVGLARAKSMTMLGEKISSSKLLELGAIHRVVAEEQLRISALELAKQLAASATVAIGLTKNLLNSSFGRSLHEQLDAEEMAQQSCGLTEDYQAGVSAFLERKAAVFKGR